MENPDQVFSKEQIYRSVWNDEHFDANTIMVFINHLRNKIEADPKNAKYLKTIWGSAIHSCLMETRNVLKMKNKYLKQVDQQNRRGLNAVWSNGGHKLSVHG